MIFNSVTYFVFLIIVVGVYWTVSERIKLWLLFLSGIVFYGFWRVEFLPVMFATATIDYYMSLLIYKTPDSEKKKRLLYLVFSLVANLGLLAYFKYLNFFTQNVSQISHMLGFNFSIPIYDIILPLGISFYTFESISYTVDVYRKHIKPEKDYVSYGAFITFFAHLVAGPILRAGELIGQLKVRPAFKIEFLSDGVQRILYGLFLKVFLADNISPLVDQGFALNTASMSALDVWTLAFLFGFQIYFDFSAYSHIAIGSSKLLGIKIPENFNFPYVAYSFKNFWQRWHISLSSWIRDYLYLPLMGAKVKGKIEGGIGESINNDPTQKKKNQMLFITWAIMGLWHGANWTFVFWGVYHATLVFIERILTPWRNKIPHTLGRFLGWSITLPLVMLSWVPFRAQSMSQVTAMFSKLIQPKAYLFLGMRENVYLVTAIMFLLFSIAYLTTEYLAEIVERYQYASFAINIIKYAALTILVFTFLRPINQFIYFQF